MNGLLFPALCRDGYWKVIVFQGVCYGLLAYLVLALWLGFDL